MKTLRTFAANFVAAKAERKMLKAGALAAALSLIATAPTAQAGWLNFGRPVDRGGNILSYMGRVSAAPGQRYVISGDCMSACTMWLGHKGTCVEADAVLYFHGAADDRFGSSGGVNPLGNALLLGMYPPRVRAAVRPWLRSAEFHTLTGRQLASLGVPLCRGTSA